MPYYWLFFIYINKILLDLTMSKKNEEGYHIIVPINLPYLCNISEIIIKKEYLLRRNFSA